MDDSVQFESTVRDVEFVRRVEGIERTEDEEADAEAERDEDDALEESEAEAFDRTLGRLVAPVVVVPVWDVRS